MTDTNHQDSDTKNKVLVIHTVSLKDMLSADGLPPESRLGERVNYARKDLGLNIEALSRLTKEYDPSGSGLSPTSISRYESGETLPGLREFRLLHEALDVPMSWLVYGVEDPKPPQNKPEEALLLYALKQLVRAQRDDSTPASEVDHEWLKDTARMEKLNRARRPPG